MYKVKWDEFGAIVKHKARLIARGFVQCEGIDFEEVFAPVARMELVRLLLALAAVKDLFTPEFGRRISEARELPRSCCQRINCVQIETS